jgi:hypothetical protein
MKHVIKYMPEEVLLPMAGESAGIAAHNKTAALCYDRIWGCSDDVVPRAIRCFGGSRAEVALVKMFSDPERELGKLKRLLEGGMGAEDGLIRFQKAIEPTSLAAFLSLMFKWISHEGGPLHSGGMGQLRNGVIFKAVLQGMLGIRVEDPRFIEFFKQHMGEVIDTVNRKVAKAFWMKHKRTLSPIYASRELRDCQYREGDRSIVAVALSNLEVVSEDDLTWEQVLEFRKDRDAKEKYRRFLHWLDRDMIGRSQAYIEDEIALRLGDYKAALKKHGIRTLVGTIEEVLDGKYLIGVASITGSMTLAGHPTLGGLAGAGLVVGKVGVKLVENLLDFDDAERGANSEISWVYQLKELTK